jgi:predicted MFS family arabinose efflux permease
MSASGDARLETGPETVPSAPRSAKARRLEMMLLGVLASVQFTSIVDFMVVMPLGPQLIRTLEISPAQFAMIVSSYTISAGLSGLLASSFMDRFSRKAAFLTLYAGFLVGTLFCGVASGYLMLLAARIVTGAFGGILGGMSLAIIGDVFPEERRGRATGVLMSAFALASVVGVPAGLWAGTKYGWNAPFLILAALGFPLLLAGLLALPSLSGHLERGPHPHPLIQIRDTFSHANHLKAFALVLTMMLGAFIVIPFISVDLVANVGVPETSLPLVFVTGGALTMIGAPVVGRLADRYGKLVVYRVVATVAAILILVLTNLPQAPLWIAVTVVGCLMLSNAGRMVAALAMVTGSVEPRRRGGFMSANSAVQHFSTGLAAYVGGQILARNQDGTIRNFDKVGLIAVAATALSLWLAGRVRPAPATPPADSSTHSGDDRTAGQLAAAETR